MKNIKYVITFGIVLACVVLFAACDTVLKPMELPTPPENGYEHYSGNSYGRISISFTGAGAAPQSARTITPVLPAFDKYEFFFTKSGAVTMEEPDAAGDFILEVGEYTVEVLAYIDEEDPLPAASGVSDPFDVGPGFNDPVTVLLEWLAAGDGEFSYTITWPAGATVVEEISLLIWPGLGDITLDPDTIPAGNGITQTLQPPAGSYLFTVVLRDGEKYAGISEALYIYPDNPTNYTKNFAANEFMLTLRGTVSISGTAAVDETLTADTSALDPGGTIVFHYQWKRDDGTGPVSVGTDSAAYDLTAADADSTITVTVTRPGYFGSVTSAPTAAVTKVPLSGTVSISGDAYVGQTLTADTSDLDGSGTIEYQWMRGTTPVGTDSDTYDLTADDAGETITVTVTRADNSGSVTSDPTDPVGPPLLTGTVSISGDAYVGQTLTADTSDLDGSGTIVYQWQRDDGTGPVPVGTDSDTYELTADDESATITVTVTRADNSGSVTSDPTDPVAP
jgi:hypothetical protein